MSFESNYVTVVTIFKQTLPELATIFSRIGETGGA